MLITPIEDNYDDDINDVLNYLSFELLEESLTSQINELSNLNVNYVNTFQQKLSYIYENYNDNENVLNEVNNLKDEFYNKIQNLIEEKFGFKIEFKSLVLNEEKYFMITQLYNFFIINLNNILLDYLKTFSKREMKSIIKSCRNNINPKDIYFTLLKKKFNKELATFIFSLDKIPNMIDFEFIEDFIEDIVSNDPDETSYYTMNKVFVSEEVTESITCDIDKFKSLIKNTIKNDHSIIVNLRVDIYNEFEPKEEGENDDNK